MLLSLTLSLELLRHSRFFLDDDLHVSGMNEDKREKLEDAVTHEDWDGILLCSEHRPLLQYIYDR